MIKIYFKNTGMSGSAETIEYPNADGYGFKDADWVAIKAGADTVAVIAASAIQRIEGDVDERRSHYRPPPAAGASAGPHGDHGISPFAKP
ncbi:MAG TPA: hypothetical protein VMP11_01235 [Verrucomicrobiae bacterium]|nr:hypothetical protein [Verrucomicrobiae bacterium]